MGGKVSYTYITPEIKNKSSAWIPCILSSGLYVGAVLGDNFHITLSGGLTWNSGIIMGGVYQANSSSLSESIDLSFAWKEYKWGVSSFVGANFSTDSISPNCGLAFTVNLFGK